MITAAQLVAHGVGDYVLQSNWMAQEKTKSSWAACAHALAYTTPFAFLTQSIVALSIIAASHFVIDRWKLARYVVWAKNFLAPPSSRPRPWSECKATGYDPETPAWMAVWLMIIADNVMHVICNGAAIAYAGSLP